MKILFALLLIVSLSLPLPCDAKESFATRHPKLHAVGRKIHHFCIIMTPVVSFCGSAAQVGYFIVQVVHL